MITFDRDYFEALYQDDIDPWKFRISEYERLKYEKTIAVLPTLSFKKCLELGCSIGTLTCRLLSRCKTIVAIDTSLLALEEARATCSSQRVEFRQAHLPEGNLGSGYDLVVASEVLYYLDSPSLCRLAHRLRDVTAPGAYFVGVHWMGPTNYPLSANEATQLCFRHAKIEHIQFDVEPKFRLDVGRFSRGS